MKAMFFGFTVVAALSAIAVMQTQEKNPQLTADEIGRVKAAKSGYKGEEAAQRERKEINKERQAKGEEPVPEKAEKKEDKTKKSEKESDEERITYDKKLVPDNTEEVEQIGVNLYDFEASADGEVYNFFLYVSDDKKQVSFSMVRKIPEQSERSTILPGVEKVNQMPQGTQGVTPMPMPQPQRVTHRATTERHSFQGNDSVPIRTKRVRGYRGCWYR